jgi:hypothetical protein
MEHRVKFITAAIDDKVRCILVTSDMIDEEIW